MEWKKLTQEAINILRIKGDIMVANANHFDTVYYDNDWKPPKWVSTTGCSNCDPLDYSDNELLIEFTHYIEITLPLSDN